MSALQLGLIIAGVVLVIGVILYNQWQERRARRLIAGGATRSATAAPASRGRTEPTLGGADDDEPASRAPPVGAAAARGPTELPATPFAVPMDDVTTLPADARDDANAPLDDADATAADDPNTERFCRMVAQMSAETQFLFISHNKITMEMANQLVGITMPEPGVSRVVAVDIAEALELAVAVPVAAAAD